MCSVLSVIISELFCYFMKCLVSNVVLFVVLDLHVTRWRCEFCISGSCIRTMGNITNVVGRIV